MMDKSLAKIREWISDRTGASESTGLEAVDKGIASFVSGFFSMARITEPSESQQRFAAFLARPPAERVYVGRYDSAIEFLHAMKRARSGAGRRPRKPGQEQGRDLINHDALPLINVSRTFDVGYENQDRSKDVRDIGKFCDPKTGKPLVELERTQAMLTYSVTFIAAEKETLSLMCNAYAGRMKQLLSTKVKADTILVRVPVSLECALMGAKDVSFSDVSSPMNEERLFAAQTTIDVTAEVMTAWEVEARPKFTQMSVSLRAWNEGGRN